jgi:membrane complex biogenesis BtpA family protein
MTALACAVRRQVDLPLGINVLRNDALTALAVAHAAGGAFIRVNVLCGARLTDQGLIQGRAHELLRLRRQLAADSIRILADLAVKHSAPLADRPLTEEAEETLDRGLADGLIVSGPSTGRPPQPEQLTILRQARPDAILLVGSGIAADNASQFTAHADAVIVGSAWQRDGRAGNPVVAERVRELLSRLGR